MEQLSSQANSNTLSLNKVPSSSVTLQSLRDSSPQVEPLETAEELLVRIQAEKAELIKQGNNKREKEIRVIRL